MHQPIEMPTNNISGFSTKNQMNNTSWQSAVESRESSEFAKSVVQSFDPESDALDKVSTCQVTRSQPSYWNAVSANMAVWGQVKDEIPSGTASGDIMRSTDENVDKTDDTWGKILKSIVAERRDESTRENKDERKVRTRIDPVGGKEELDAFTRGYSRAIRPTSGKDRHSKVNTSKGPRDRRVRLSVPTAVQFYDVQDRLGFDQPSKAVEWLMKKAKTAIDELCQLPFTSCNETQSSSKDLTNAAFPLRETSSSQAYSTSMSSNIALAPPASQSLPCISDIETDLSQSQLRACGSQLGAEKTEIEQTITETSEEKNGGDMKTTNEDQPQERTEENYIACQDDGSNMESASRSASFQGYYLHKTPFLNTLSPLSNDIQTSEANVSLINYKQEPVDPWYGVSSGTQQERPQGLGPLGRLSQSHTQKQIQDAYLHNFEFSSENYQSSPAEAMFPNMFHKASINSQIAGVKRHGQGSQNIPLDPKIYTRSCNATSTRIFPSNRDEYYSMSTAPWASQFSPLVTNSTSRTPAMYCPHEIPKHPPTNTFLFSNPCTMSNPSSFLLRPKLDPDNQQLQGVLTRQGWLSANNLDQNMFSPLPSQTSTHSSVFSGFHSQDGFPIVGKPSSARESTLFSDNSLNVLLSSGATNCQTPLPRAACPPPLLWRSEIPARIQGMDELHDVLEKPPP
ncbi:hypothetical protein O6H91_02G111100 [Diphasiastrum complanatum]|uniref:Uncharacterized protein n=1 Tax=Diphasiastrum complanatum TaxID=34168 RepID=A0ACC2EJQ3_DIPCM|nr:hypothetical protein O6H91_02G111100 [Diphasiastrum complanatum]